MDVIGIGTVILPILIHGKTDSESNSFIKLLHVLHAPTCPFNLISYDRIVEKFTFTGGRAGAVISDHLRQTIFTALRRERLLFLEQPGGASHQAAQAYPTMSNKQASNSLSLWHARMGHLNEKDICSLHVSPHPLLHDLPQICQSCVYGKQHRTPSHTPMPRCDGRLQLIHSDVEEISPIAYGGYRYFVAFIDDHTRMEFGYLMKQKNEVFQKFVEFQRLVERETGEKIKRLRADNGLGEYTNADFTSYRKRRELLSSLLYHMVQIRME